MFKHPSRYKLRSKFASSTADFINKLNVAAKEARETSYWLRLLHDNQFLPPSAFDSIHAHNQELLKLLSSILLTTKSNRPNS